MLPWRKTFPWSPLEKQFHIFKREEKRRKEKKKKKKKKLF